MDPSVGGFGEQRPGDSVDQQPEAAEERHHQKDAAHDQRIDAEPHTDTGSDPADPSIRSARDADPANGVEEAAEPIGGRWFRCREVHASSQPAELSARYRGPP